MSLQGALASMQSHIISTIVGFDSNNCSIGDEAIFNYIQTTSGAQEKCCMIEYNGLVGKSKTEFRSVTMGYKIVVNAFFMIKDYDYVTPLQNARSFIDFFIAMCASDPTFGGDVLIARVESGGEPLEYKRGNFAYVLVTLEMEILDNVS
jgi:hypothetical protein